MAMWYHLFKAIALDDITVPSQTLYLITPPTNSMLEVKKPELSVCDSCSLIITPFDAVGYTQRLIVKLFCALAFTDLKKGLRLGVMTYSLTPSSSIKPNEFMKIGALTTDALPEAAILVTTELPLEKLAGFEKS